LRHDNADLRLAHHGHAVGLVGAARLRRVEEKAALLARGLDLVRERRCGAVTAECMLQRPDAAIEDLADALPELFVAPFDAEVRRLIAVEARYSGYVERQRGEIERLRAAEAWQIPSGFDFAGIAQMRHEAREKFTRIRPRTIGQAARISGISQPDVSLLMIHLRKETD